MVALKFKEWWIKTNMVEGECNCHIGEYFDDMTRSKNEEYFASLNDYNKYVNQLKLETYN